MWYKESGAYHRRLGTKIRIERHCSLAMAAVHLENEAEEIKKHEERVIAFEK